MSTICFYAQFTKTLVGVNALTVTWDIEQITRSDGTRSALVTGGANGVTVGRRGLYGYVLTNADLTLYDYVATAITAGDVDQKEVAAMWTYWSEAGPTLANQTTLLARIGAFTGSGVNTILGFLKAMASKAATLPTDIGGTFSPVTDSLEKLGETFAASSVSMTGVVSGSTHTWYRGHYAQATITLGVDITGYSKIYYCIKRSKEDADAVSMLLVEKTAGVSYINGAAIASPVVAGDVTLTVTTEATGVIVVTVNSRAANAWTKEMESGRWGVKVVYTATTDAQFEGEGPALIKLDIPKAIT